MINKFLAAKESGDPSITCWGDGSPTREFLYVDDMADACVFLMNTYDGDDFLNVGSDTEIKIKDLANIIKKSIGYTGKIVWDKSLPNGTPRRKMDNTKLFDLGWKPSVSFDDGLKRTVEWYLQNKK
jgi:GDP-L-fucose synthase